FESGWHFRDGKLSEPGLRKQTRRLPYYPAVNYDTLLIDRLEIHLVLVDFDEHERVVFIIAHSSQGTPGVNVATTHFAACAGDEMLDSLLQLEPLVKVIVTREHDLYLILCEHRLKDRPQFKIRAVLFPG